MGCTTTKDKVVIKNPGIARPYPPLPSDQVVECAIPPLRLEQPAKLALSQNRKALKICKSKHRALVKFYTQLRNTKS